MVIFFYLIQFCKKHCLPKDFKWRFDKSKEILLDNNIKSQTVQTPDVKECYRGIVKILSLSLLIHKRIEDKSILFISHGKGI